jgi:ribonuclease HI
VLYTDGACSRKHGRAAYGWVRLLHGAVDGTFAVRADGLTNNQAEMMGVIHGLDVLAATFELRSRPVVFCDSQYVVNGYNEWYDVWIRRRWRTVDGEPIKNQQHWRRLHEIGHRVDVDLRWVRGHAGVTYNEVVDKMLVAEMGRA